ncbi:hybrid sensor histidine kinase/response regulator [Spiribacter halobius]|uniref:Chemotaxis protein CheA n=1 Tax=Sediminicurvatus halobius TaxID=2182432 RepID=A0A2U2MW66_9GAMM|nr:response regulator [Spiribacter halobius]PWG61105.1 hypothetical protein DEM34_18075 [Spiribacter halobius]UEX77074.1 response regulator [Spiribacter halobius]
MSSSEVLDCLAEAVAATADPLAEALAEFCAAADEDTAAAALEPCIDELERLGDGARAAGLEVLAEVCARLGEGLSALSVASAEARVAVMDGLLDWPAAVLHYLQEPEAETAAAGPVTVLADPAWPQPLDDAQATALVGRLMDDAGGAEPEDPATAGAAGVREATPAAVSLAPAAGVDPQVVDAFLQDAPEQAAGLAAALAALARGEAAAASRDTARRLAHTLKGAAAVAGIEGVANLTHRLEDILDHLSATDGVPDAPLMTTLTAASDCLEAMIDALLGRDQPPADAVAVLQAVIDAAAALETGAPAPEAPSRQALPAAAEATADPASAPDHTGEAAEPQRTLRVPLPTVDTLFRVTGELAVEAGQLEAVTERLQGLQRRLAEQDQVVQQRIFELEDLIDVRDVASAGYGLGAAVGGDFDPLEMDRYNELHSCSRALAEAVADWRELRLGVDEEIGRLRTLLAGQRRLNQDLEASVLATRLLPVSGLVPRLQRAVRQAARVSGREASLEIQGESLQLDAEILDGLMDPLLHLLRNAVDHGIEAPSVRAARGKPASGRLQLSFSREGSLAVVRCRDDGAGLDLDAIRHQARLRGLAEAPEGLSDAAAARLVLLPGFSTREAVSQLSGRGVGLDVVNDRVRRLKGRLDIRTMPGEGSEFIIRLPASLVSLHCLLVQAGGEQVAVPGSDVQRVPLPAAGGIETVDGETRYRSGEEDYPAISLAALLGRRAEAPPAEAPVLLVAADEGVTAVAVDTLVGSRDLVLKGFGRYLPALPGVRGGAILGDGTVTTVLDLPALLRAPALTEAAVALGEAAEPLRAGGADVLIVDDSLSVRRALGQCLEDAGYHVRRARDGVEAVAMIAERTPQLVVADLEMPRMNGLELTQRLRADTATRALPVIMLTSRAMEKHRRQAEAAGVTAYLTKPFQEEGLLDSVATALA